MSDQTGKMMFDHSKILKSEKMVCKLSNSGIRLYEPSRNKSEMTLATNRTSNAPSVKVPEPHINSFANPCQTEDIFTINKNFVKYWEKQEEELNEQVEYDLDDEDLNWLDEVNQGRNEKGNRPIELADMAQMMDRLEKESFFQLSSTNDQRNQMKVNDSGETNEDALCSVCLDGECLANNVILFCDMCNLAVHQECYGVPYVPEGQWLCRRCLQSPSAPVKCELCHSKNGAFKQTDKGGWVHMVCAIWVPEVHFANTIFLEPVMGIERIDKQRWRLLCYICRKRGGACIQCDKSNCYTAFHVTCAQQAGLYMKIREEVVEQRVQPQKSRKKGAAARQRRKNDHYDDEGDTDKSVDTINSDQTKNTESPNSSTEKEVRKCAYCDLHTPMEVLSPNIRKKFDRKKINAASRDEFLKKAQKARMEKARRILAEKQNRPPIINMPTIPEDRIKSIAELIDIDEKDQFLERLIGYWRMKRFSRNGVPLVRRLQRTAIKLSSSTDNNNSEKAVTTNELDQFFMLRKLRTDLERARLLIEMVKKREKLKREERLIDQLITLHHLRPFYVILSLTLDQLVASDQKHIFAQPVNAAEAPGYYDTIKYPMDFTTMRNKIDAMEYENLSEFENDIKLIVDNCLSYNVKGDPYYNAGVKLKTQSAQIMKNALEQYNMFLNDCSIQNHGFRGQNSNGLVSNQDNLSMIENALKQLQTSGDLIKSKPAFLQTSDKQFKEITSSCLNSPVNNNNRTTITEKLDSHSKKRNTRQTFVL